MNFRTTFLIPEAQRKLSFGDSVVLMGSCFSERIGQKLTYYGFDTLINPFGTIFHPTAIANLLDGNNTKDIRTNQRNGSWFTFEAHSAISAKSKTDLMNEFQIKQNLLSAYLEKSKLLIITLGSAWGYFLNDEIVANCHKMPSQTFQKRLSEVRDMCFHWSGLIEQLKFKYPKLEILFTVSPVRHTKDGFIENQLSKARLIELVHRLDVDYFPAYELQMDDLRDYRFYESDLIHPNSLAVDYIFDSFAKHKIEVSSQRFFSIIHKFRMFEAHQIKPFDQEKFEEHQQEVELKRGQLRCQIPELCI